ncbi:putative membrane protein [Campylobacter lanienae NCTC 13004]|uniref:Putative membrane protein n=1 Tax=Campylobacter lanienae NCTC 13004 TaxID=1031753 RepID=A0A1X9SNM2_9BACT|nr:pentapeptide repeat-containing protein [Campylobacter lanienae]ARQ97832.1 putative membrane protein [Campylobacter lanienae NCTC 13004]
MEKKDLASIFGVETKNIIPSGGNDNIKYYDIDDRVDVKEIPDDFHLLFKNIIQISLNCGGKFENCSFKNKIFLKKILFLNPCEFKNCVFDNNYLSIISSSQFLGCSFENIDNFLEFASKNTFKECVYKSDLKLCGNEEKEYQKKIKISNFTFHNKVEFIGQTFKDEVRFDKVIFEDEVDFTHSIFNKNIVCYECEFKKQLNFENCKFIETADNSLSFKEVKFHDIITFKHSVFDAEVNFDNFTFNNKADFSKSTFEKKASFKHCTFNNFFDFSEIHFKDNVYFDDSDFNEFAAFHLCVFEKTASFYRTKFNVIPNFSPGDFKGILNINNATWGKNGNLEFEDVRSIVKEAYGKIKTEKELETIRNIKDSFRAIKNILIQKNDQLDAQKFHKAELYCKELELEEENKNFSTYIDSLLLRFYRNTSDHHTNFLKILNFTVFCIAVYAVCSFLFVNIYTATFFGETGFFGKNTSEGIFSWLYIGLIFLAIIILFSMLKDCEPITFFRYLCLFIIFALVAVFVNNYSPTIAKFLLLLFCIIAFSLLLIIKIEKGLQLFFFLYLCFCAIPVLLSIVYFILDIDKNYVFKITIPSIISTCFCLVIFFSYSLEEKYLRKRKYKNLILPVFKCFVWGIVAFVLYLQPQLINPFVGVFKSDEILSTNYFEKKLNDLNVSEIIKISNLLKNSTDLNLTGVHKEIIDLNTITNTEIINAKELIKQNLKEINITNNELNTTINNLKEVKDLQEYLVNGIKSSSLVYSIILLLCLYSLTKTARKNSIVPI